MIPKIIHYCWFGRNPLPKSAMRCIESWRKHSPKYENKECKEDNYNVDMMPLTREEKKKKKYAFVSDVARFWILYHHGGLYFDTDVEVIRPMHDIVEHGAFMGIEVECGNGNIFPLINPGLGLGAEPGMEFYRRVLEHYSSCHFLDADGNQIPGTVVSHNTQVLREHGLQPHNDIQTVADITIYPIDYFNPLDDATGVLRKTKNTRSIHWYDKTWLDNYGPVRKWLTRIIHRYFGINSIAWIKHLFSK